MKVLSMLLVSIFSIFITPDSSNALQVVDKEFIIALFLGLFVLISLIIIAYKSYKLRGK